MAQRHRRLKPAAYAVINTTILIVCAFSFFQIGLHQAKKPETSGLSQTSDYSVEENETTSTATTTRKNEITSTTTTKKADVDSTWYYRDEPWANAYQELLWQGEYRADFERNAIVLNTEGYMLDEDGMLKDYNADIEIYAALIYFNDDDIPELALTSTYHSSIYTFTNDTVQLVGSFDSHEDMLYCPKKMWLRDYYYKTMGGLHYMIIYDFSENGLVNGTEQVKYFDLGAPDPNRDYFAENEELGQYWGDWTSLKKDACLVSSFAPNDVIEKLHRSSN